ncbi:hypothetical protein BDW72DRAFT_77356 [Aspergillus terricola var. indicus]
MAVLREASLLHSSIVQYSHHRQFSDILAILLLVRRAGHENRYQSMKEDFIGRAKAALPQNDPRRSMFETLDHLEIDTTVIYISPLTLTVGPCGCLRCRRPG